MSKFDAEVRAGDRFEFGSNWLKYLESVNEEKIVSAEGGLLKLASRDSIKNKTFLDVGCGSGIHSLAAHRLGAAKIFSFDYDPNSVQSTKMIKEKHASDANWQISEGSILDPNWLKSIGQYDMVYSWGVLHHTGKMYEAFENISSLVKPNGHLCIAIYNYQPFLSQYWTLVKRLYNHSPYPMKQLLGYLFFIYFASVLFAADVLRKRNPLSRHLNRGTRGMVVIRDVFDWIGGYPFEVAKPEEIFHFFKTRGFVLENLITVSGKHGCNEFCFRKEG